MGVKVVHAADFHLDSAFAALSAEQAKLRRRESRDLMERLANYVNQNEVEIVLLAGDLFDSGITYRDTIARLVDALGAMSARVFIAPGNHDFYSAKSPYATLHWPENVHIFRTDRIERVEIPELGCTVYGVGFTTPSRTESFLKDFSAEDDAGIRLMVLHGELGNPNSSYAPLLREEIAQSGVDYLALGHTHEHSGVLTAGETTYAYAGCPEGRGFDELGEKGILAGTVSRGSAEMRFVPFARRRYEILTVDVSGKDAETALRAALPGRTADDLYRVIFAGESDERGVDLARLYERLAPEFFHLELRDSTRIAEDVWARAEEDSLRGLFLRDLRTQMEGADEAQREKIVLAARYGLAALDGRDL